MRIEFQLDWDKVLSRNIRLLASNITDMQSEFNQVWKLVVDKAKKNIDQGWSETGGKYTPLSQRTQQMRARRSGYYKQASKGASASGPALKWTGRMQDAFRADTTADTITISNPTPYFRFHQAKIRQSAKLPRRLTLELSNADKNKVMSILAGWLNKKLEWGNFWRQF